MTWLFLARANKLNHNLDGSVGSHEVAIQLLTPPPSSDLSIHPHAKFKQEPSKIHTFNLEPRKVKIAFADQLN